MEYKKKYTTGGSAGYGVDYSYRDNTLNSNINNEAAYNENKNQYYTNLANTTYQNTTNDIQTEYNNTMSKATSEVAVNKQREALVTTGIKSSLNYKPSGSESTYGQNFNDYFSEKVGYLGMGVEEGNQIDPAGFFKEKITDPIKNTFTNKAASTASETIMSQAPNQTLKGANASYSPEFFSNVGGNIVDDATGEVAETLVEEVGGDLTASVAEDVIGTAAQDVATDVVTDVATDVAVGTASKAPVKGGGWTVAADLGLHYLSDDKDDSTYTGGEVATDIASLGLDIVTFDWLGAGMQLWDIGSQWVRRNKLQKEKKIAERKADVNYTEAKLKKRDDLYSAKDYIGYNQGSTGKRSGFGRGELGGFSKYI
tara:strand:- start:2764 stop:3870 length:1107 start_codon:yes stop_codon:yes gene_type:complete